MFTYELTTRRKDPFIHLSDQAYNEIDTLNRSYEKLKYKSTNLIVFKAERKI